MKIFRIGSCRVFLIPNVFYGNINFVNESIGYTHSIKEHIQLIKYLRGELEIPTELLQYVYTFYAGDLKKQNIDKLFHCNKLALEKTDAYLIEICSLKVIKHKDIYLNLSNFLEYYLWNLPKPDDSLLAECIQYKQCLDEFSSDFEELIYLCHNKPIIFTGHLNLKKENNQYIESRQLINSLIKQYSTIHNKFYYDLSPKISREPNKYVEQDLIHLKKPSLYLARDSINTLLHGDELSKFAKFILRIKSLYSRLQNLNISSVQRKFIIVLKKMFL